jgi:hypothetical protein
MFRIKRRGTILYLLIVCSLTGCNHISKQNLNKKNTELQNYCYNTLDSMYNLRDSVDLNGNIILFSKTTDINPIYYQYLEFEDSILKTYKFYNIISEDVAYELSYDSESMRVKCNGFPIYIIQDTTIFDTTSFTFHVAAPPYSKSEVSIYEIESGSNLKFIGTEKFREGIPERFSMIIKDKGIDTLKYLAITKFNSVCYNDIDTFEITFTK